VPELPEVETVLRTIAPRVVGGRILEARFRSALVMRAEPEETAARLRGRIIAGARRLGKFLVFDLAEGATLLIHLGMTGRLLWDAAPGPHTRAEFVLDRGRLVYDDIRQFGRIEVNCAVPERVARLGPDPLVITTAEFAGRLRARRARIKAVLLDQHFVAGIGNIYADEALFRAGVHPRAIATRLGRERARRLHRAIQEVLRAAIESGGSSISDYVDGDGRRGSFQLSHAVYGKEGEPCTACGTAIRRIVIAQRGTHYCPRCQRA
jgi:formamidopyrimidine-DNA glycosylase